VSPAALIETLSPACGSSRLGPLSDWPFCTQSAPVHLKMRTTPASSLAVMLTSSCGNPMAITLPSVFRSTLQPLSSSNWLPDNIWSEPNCDQMPVPRLKRYTRAPPARMIPLKSPAGIPYASVRPSRLNETVESAKWLWWPTPGMVWPIWAQLSVA